MSSTEALRLTDQVAIKAGKKLSLEAAEKTITNLMRAMWLNETSKGKLVLGVRFIGEMESWMVEVMGEDNIRHCQACRKIVVRGGFCPAHPEAVWHIYCLEKSARLKADIKCGVCGKKITVGGRARPTRDEREQELGEEEEEVSQRPRKQAGRGGRRSQAVEQEEEEIEKISPRPGPSTGEPSKTSKRTRRESGNEARMEVEEEPPSQAGRSRIKRRASGESESDSD